MNKDKYFELLSGAPFLSVSLRHKRVTLFRQDKLAKAQIGYSVDAEGQSLVGSEAGYWKENWFVIGNEGEFGDPIFVDLSSEQLPVFTAMHGEGDWEPEPIADSFPGFIQSLEQVRSVSKREKPPSPVLKNIEQVNPNSSLGFWERWLLG